jgi:hypothetical protein
MTTTNTTEPRCHVALELSRSRWLVGALLPGRAKVALHTVPGGDAHGLLALLRRVEARAGAEAGMAVPLAVCLEAGYDGFWLARYLRQRGIQTQVLDAPSFLVSRRGRRAKTDRLDVEAMALVLGAPAPICCRRRRAPRREGGMGPPRYRATWGGPRCAAAPPNAPPRPRHRAHSPPG